MLLARRSRRLSVPLRFITKPLSLDLYAMSRYFFLSHRYSLRVRMWSALENAPPIFTARTSSALTHRELKYFSCADFTVFRIPSPTLLTGIVLRAHTMGERVLVFLNKRRGKKVSRIIFSNPVNASPMSQVAPLRKIHSDWIARTTAA